VGPRQKTGRKREMVLCCKNWLPKRGIQRGAITTLRGGKNLSGHEVDVVQGAERLNGRGGYPIRAGGAEREKIIGGEEGVWLCSLLRGDDPSRNRSIINPSGLSGRESMSFHSLLQDWGESGQT